MEQDRVLQFLMGLNQEYDQLCDRVEAKEPFLDLEETFLYVRGEESSKELNNQKPDEFDCSTMELSALVTKRPGENKRDDEKDKLWCDFYNNPSVLQ